MQPGARRCDECARLSATFAMIFESGVLSRRRTLGGPRRSLSCWVSAFALLSCGLGAAPSTAVRTAMVENGRPGAVIVTADQPTAVARYAAQELAYHVEKATGVKLIVTTESA